MHTLIWLQLFGTGTKFSYLVLHTTSTAVVLNFSILVYSYAVHNILNLVLYTVYSMYIVYCIVYCILYTKFRTKVTTSVATTLGV